MFKAISGISKKILVVSIVTLFLVSVVFFVSPGKVYANGFVLYSSTVALAHTTVSVANGTTEANAKLSLDQTVGVVGAASQSGTATIVWTIASYSETTPRDYTATGVLTLPAGWTGSPADVTATVTVEAAPTTPPKPLTPEDWVLLDLNITQLLEHYGASSDGFIKMLYDNILGRVTDAGGLNNWLTALDNGTMTPGDVVYHIVFSEELAPTISSFSDAEFITFLYKNVFNREPDSEGYDGWVNAMGSGMSKEEVLLLFLESDEFGSICEMFGLTP